MADIFDEATAAADAGPSGDIFDAITSHVDRESEAGALGVNSVSAQLGKGLAFGWFDEFQAAEGGVRNAIAGLFGRANPENEYAARLQRARATDAAVEKAHPYASTALELTGALAPTLATAGLASAPAAAESLGTAAIKALFGATRATPKALAASGALAGAAAGAGEATEGNRLKGAAVGGTVGAVAGPVLGKTIEVVGHGLADVAAPAIVAIKDIFGRGVASESGALGRGTASAIPERLTPGEMVVAKQLKNTPIERVEEGALQLEEAISRDQPLFLPEAVGSPKTYRNARFIANYEPSMEFSQRAIESRRAGASSRVANILDEVSPQRNTYQGGVDMSRGAGEVLEGARDTRRTLTKDIYKEAFSNGPEYPRAGSVINEGNDVGNFPLKVKDGPVPNMGSISASLTNYEVLPGVRKVPLSSFGEGKFSEFANVNEVKRTKDLAKEISKNREITPLIAIQDKDGLYILEGGHRIRALEMLGAKEVPVIIARDLDSVGQAGVKLVNDPAVNRLIEKDQNFRAAIREVKKDSDFADLPDNSLVVLHEAKQVISDKADTASRAGATKEAGRFSRKYQTINKALFEASPEYERATGRYRDLSTGVTELEESKLSFLESLHPDKIDRVGEVFRLPPERISELRQSFVAAGQGDEFNAGIRAYLQNLVDNTRDGQNVVRGMISSDAKRAQLRAALGDSYDRVLGPLETEGVMFAGSGRYHPGSSTEGNFAERDAFDESVGIIANFLGGNRMEAVKRLFSGDLPEEVAQEVAEIYFDPKRGAKSLGKIMPLLEQYSQNKGIAEVAGKGTNAATSRGSNLGIGQEAPVPTSKPIQDVFKNTKKTEAKSNMGSRTREEVEKDIDADPYFSALYEHESGRNPAAVSGEGSSAVGAFQFMPGTAKALKLKDRTDLEASFNAVKELTSQHDRMFGADPASRYSAHFLGATVFEKLRNGEKLTPKEAALVAQLYEDKRLPRFMRKYSEKIA